MSTMTLELAANCTQTHKQIKYRKLKIVIVIVIQWQQQTQCITMNHLKFEISMNAFIYGLAVFVVVCAVRRVFARMSQRAREKRYA